MLSALLVALREGVEAALVVGIVLVYLNRTGRRALTKYVWAGVALAAGASVVAAILLDRWKVSEDGFEGLLMLLASALVVTMIIWMNRVARTLRKDIESRLETYAQQPTRAAGWGIGAFVFLMVVREGAELVLILRAVELSSAGVEVWIGTLLGIGLAVAVGLFFFQGTLKIPLHRFFAATSVILMVGMPLALGSYWGLLVLILGPLVLVFRIRDEEKLLTQELAGYREYRERVRYRLMPNVW